MPLGAGGGFEAYASSQGPKGFGFGVKGLGAWDFGFRVWVLRFRASVLRLRVRDLPSRVVEAIAGFGIQIKRLVQGIAILIRQLDSREPRNSNTAYLRSRSVNLELSFRQAP